MTAFRPRDVIVEHLTRPSRRPPRTPTDELQPRPVAFIVHGNPFTAQPDTIRFVKERGARDRRLYAVTFKDQDAEPWFWLIAAERDQTGDWAAHDVAGGSGAIPQRKQPQQPWLNLCGNWGQGHLYAGGEIHTVEVPISEVRLILADGTQLADNADEDVALFSAPITTPHPPQSKSTLRTGVYSPPIPPKPAHSFTSSAVPERLSSAGRLAFKELSHLVWVGGLNQAL